MRAVLDACVLVPDVTRRLLLAAAGLGHFVPVWSARILGEWERAAGKDGAVAGTFAREEIARVSARFPEAAVAPGVLPTTLPDPGDEHVLAACIAGEAGFLVTRNHRDFPPRTLARFGVSREDPDTLLLAFLREDARLAEAVAALAEGFGAPAPAVLKRAGLPRLAKALR